MSRNTANIASNWTAISIGVKTFRKPEYCGPKMRTVKDKVHLPCVQQIMERQKCPKQNRKCVQWIVFSSEWTWEMQHKCTEDGDLDATIVNIYEN